MYEELVQYVLYRTGTSRNRTWEILGAYSEVLKDAAKRGYNLDIEGLVEIGFTTEEFIYKNTVYGIDEQVRDVSNLLNLDKYEVRNVIVVYLKRIRDRLRDGYHVNIKGICSMIPTEEDDGIVKCTTRVSPVLGKPEVADFIMVTDRGIVLQELGEDKLRFSINAKEDIEYLYEVAKEKEKKLNLKELDV